MLRPRQSLLVQRTLTALNQHGNTLAVAPTGCHAAGTQILMYDGTLKLVEHIVTGDRLMGPDSTPRQVLELHRGQDAMFEIRPMKGEPFVVNAGHILTLVRTNESRGSHAGEIVDVILTDYLDATPNFRRLHKLFRVPTDFPVQVPPTVDPYFLGVLLGDGGLKHGVNVTTPDAEIAETIYAQAMQMGLRVRVEQLPDNLANTYHLVGARGVSNVLIEALRSLGLHGLGAADKFLPVAYQRGDRDTRLAVLAGLLDTDGHLSRKVIYEYCSLSRQLAQDVAFVARSLGFLATLRRKIVAGVDYWRVYISGNCDRIPVRIVRKQAPPRRQVKDVLRTGLTVHPAGIGNYFGFTVDGDHRYLLGDFTVTHNSGKTIMLSAVAGSLLSEPDTKACILAHRTELTGQNRSKFRRVNPTLSTSVFDANEKSWDGQATFAMVQTLTRLENLKKLPTLDLLVIDEAHHAASPSYRAIIDAVLGRNPKAGICGLTATPNRGDGQGLREVFSNVSDQITLGEMIASGHLVPPRTFVIDVGVQEALKNVRKTAMDFDMDEVASILDKRLITEAVIKHWKEKASTHKTIIFCSTVAHAQNVCDAFVASGVQAVLIHGELSNGERKSRLAEYETGQAQVVVNVAVLTEGYDYTPTSCVILLRPSSYKSTFIQMVGRGLRTVDPEEFPGTIKTECIVLDFGTASLMHGSLEQEIDLDGQLIDGEAPTKDCPECDAIVPLAVMECPICGYVWERQIKAVDVLSDFVMSEIDLLNRSNFRWCDLFGYDDALMATGFNAWGGIFFLNGRWHALGGGKDLQPHLLAVGERTVCMAKADDWLNNHETADSAYKTRRWLNEPPTQKQLQYLPQAMRADFGMTRYRASTLLSFQFNKSSIRRLVMTADECYREVA
jgi:superfamily II DNA or RNA helicase